MMSLLQFEIISSSISINFWLNLNSIKLNQLKLNSNQIKIQAQLDNQNKINLSSFNDIPDTLDDNMLMILKGKIINYNTILQFKQVDKLNLLSQFTNQVSLFLSFLQSHHDTNHFHMKQIWNQCQSQSQDDNLLVEDEITIESLNQFLLLTFADLKKYQYFYWFAFPALLQKPNWKLLSNSTWEIVRSFFLSS
jgi:hypothetical protein